MKSMLFVAAFAGCLVGSGFGLPVNNQFELFKVEYAKEYETHEEHDKRQLIFEDNLEYIELHNKQAAHGLHTYELGINEFADMTNKEFVAIFNGLKFKPEDMNQENLYVPQAVRALPKEIDWRKKGYVTGVKNQGPCGSCWAFSAVGSMEGQHFNVSKKLVSLSEQNIVDCDKASSGCGGGLMVNAYKYVIKNKGDDTEASYPYKGEDEKCMFNPSNVGATMVSYRKIPSGDEIALTAATAAVGPIAVAIDASQSSFQLYKKGIYKEKNCSKERLDHGVLVVGYGTLRSDDNSRKDYWIVKNSWGTSWGQEGYILFQRGVNQCGIATMASFPLAK